MAAALRESWIWLLLAFLVGLAVGWFLRRTTYTTTTTTDTSTTTRISELEAQLEECREAASRKASANTAPLSTAPLSAATADAEVPAPVATRGQASRVAAIATPVPAATSAAKAPAKPAAKVAAVTPAPKAPAKAAPKAPAKAAPKATATRAAAAAVAAPVVDLAAGAKALGRAIKLDDLTVVEGIGPKIAELFTADGITTWRALSKADVPRLQRILDAAGPRYRMHDPKTWPKQAGLLADGKWAQFVTLTDKLSGGR